MVSQLLLDKANAVYEVIPDETNELVENVAAYHACLVSNYMAYLKAAGYSKIPNEIRMFERGARRFLSRFPDPRNWLSLSPEEQHCCGRKERSFVHYLLIRRILPMPVAYMFTRKSRFFQMAMRLMERDTYEVFQKAACRLGYGEQDTKNQFRTLLCLMMWAQKPMYDLTLEDLDIFTQELRLAYRVLADKGPGKRVRHGLPYRWDTQLKSIRNVLYHMGILPQLNGSKRGKSFEKQWEKVPLDMASVVRHYLQQLALSLRPESVYQEKTRLFRFFSWLAETTPEVTRLAQIQRYHIEAYKEYIRWTPLQHKSNGLPGDILSPATRYHLLSALFYFFSRITEWQWAEAPKRMLIFTQDYPLLDQPLPKFLDEVTAARFLQTARNHPDLFTRLCGVTLMLTGMRQGELLNLAADCMVQIGENYWLRVPLGKMHNDRFIPLHPEVKQLLDEWISKNPPQKYYDFLFTRHGCRFGRSSVADAVERIGKKAGIEEHISPHRLRHTLATLAINRGMPLESIAALLGHRSLSMTMVYARIGNRTVQQEYSAVSQYLEEICNQVNERLIKAAPVEGAQMRRLREDNWRLLGNGYCTRPDGVTCEYETICESCTCFSTTVDFLPVLNKQRQDAEEKGQAQRAQIFSRLIQTLEQAPDSD